MKIPERLRRFIDGIKPKPRVITPIYPDKTPIFPDVRRAPNQNIADASRFTVCLTDHARQAVRDAVSNANAGSDKVRFIANVEVDRATGEVNIEDMIKGAIRAITLGERSEAYGYAYDSYTITVMK